MNKNIVFNEPLRIGNEEEYISDAIKTNHISGDGKYTKLCQTLLEKSAENSKVLLTTSCSSALEMAGVLLDIKDGDEIIMPSYTFVSTANTFVLFGARIVFIDIEKKTMNMDVSKIEAAITSRTKAIVPVHYAGVSCEMDEIIDIAMKYNLRVIEDAAQGYPAKYKGRMLGSIGDIGCYSFHETKNYTMGEGGALIINKEILTDRSDIIWQKGTNRKDFINGLADKYTWVDKGSSYLPSEINAAYLYAGLQKTEVVNNYRLEIWNKYYLGLSNLKNRGVIDLPFVPDYCEHNAHMFFIKVKDKDERTKLIIHLKNNGILSVFHYIPLHSSPGGKVYGIFCGQDEYTTKESDRLLRLPIHYNLSHDDVEYVIMKIEEFYSEV